MATMSSTTGTGHSPKGERKVAGVLYIAIALAVLAALAVFFFASNNSKLNPYQPDRPAGVAPDVRNEAPGDRSGAVAQPQGGERPAPNTNPPTENQNK